MPLDQVANFIRGSTDASVDSTQTTISVVDASVFPDPTGGEYNLVFWDDNSHPRPDQDASVEIVRVTGRDTVNDDLTVTRGQESTSGASHPSGSALQLSPTAKMFGDIAPNDQAVEDFTTNSSTSGEVPTSQGDGSLLMETPSGEPNVPAWTEDANSPASVSSATSLTYTIDGTYDRILVMRDTTVSGMDANLTINGDTGANYTWNDRTGTTTSSDSHIPLAFTRDSPTFQLYDYQASRIPVDVTEGGITSTAPDSGQYQNAAPINSFTLTDDSGNQMDEGVRVFGWSF